MNEELKELVADITGMDPSKISTDTSREDAEQWDSVNHLRLITAVEEAYSVQFTMSDIEGIRTLGDLTDTLERYRSGPA